MVGKGMQGKRVAGKQKKKSIKANVTSQFSSKRKLSRMGKKVKKGTMGPNTEFVTRSVALKKLQITLKDFRRLCILKGIYPKVPSRPLKGADKVYYDIKDLTYLSHEPLLHKFREFKTFMKKIRNAAGRNQFEEARRKNDMKPNMVLDHLVKERYPRFIDALRDMDDALCMIHLFSALPSIGRISAKHTATCKTMVAHWDYYIARTKCLQKVFVSVKGFYYQVEIMGERINWVVPHSFTQVIPRDVDFRVMLTFLEFYETLMKFVLFKLYHTMGQVYPPVIDKTLNETGCFLMAIKAIDVGKEDIAGENDNAVTVTTDDAVSTFKGATTTSAKEGSSKSDNKLVKQMKVASASRLSSLESKLSQIAKNPLDEDVPEKDEKDLDGDGDEEDEGVDEEQLKNAFHHVHGDDYDHENEEDVSTFQTRVVSVGEGEDRSKLFKGLKFFVNREVALDVMQLCILSFGGMVGWEGETSPYGAKDSCITHHIIDRPLTEDSKLSAREYIQPQWIFDSINMSVLLPIYKYAPGNKLPPHLSPFVDDDKEGYVPTYKKELTSIVSKDTAKQQAIKGESVDDSDDEAGDYEKELLAEKAGTSFSQRKKFQNVEDEVSDDSDSDSGDEEEEVEVPLSSKKGPKAIVYDPATNSKKRPSSKVSASEQDGSDGEDDEGDKLSRIMMNKKSKHLYNKMQHGIQKKKDEVEVLNTKRQRLEASSGDKSPASGGRNQGADKRKGKASGSSGGGKEVKKQKK